MGTKVTIVGAGSVYTPELVTEFFRDRGNFLLPMDRLALYDTDERRLAILGGLTQRMARRQGVGAKITLTTDVREAVEDATFIITQIRVGGNQARLLDETIPIRHGVIGQETTGPGGMFKALRTIPEVVKVARAAKKYAPRAWTLSFTNPSGICAEGVTKAVPGSRLVGVCSIQVGREHWITDTLGISTKGVRVKTVGLNHLSWVYGATRNGRDLMGAYFRKLRAKRDKGAELIEAIGGPYVGYLWYYYQTDEALKHMKKAGPRAKEVLRIEKILLRRYADPTLDTQPEELNLRGGSGYSVMIGTYIRALTGERPVTIPTNTPNRGCVEGFAPDQVLEIPARISSAGIKPLPIPSGEIPEHMMGLMRRVKSYETLTVQAALTGCHKTALAAIMSHPLVPNLSTGRKILDELLKAHKRYLPQFR